jgi:protoheme IX farnesyltransferase
MNWPIAISPAIAGTEYQAGVRDYWDLLKPRVMSLVIFTAWVGLYIAPGNLHPILAATAIICIAVGSGAAGCLNMVLEISRDAKMNRTKNRPLPAGRVHPGNAMALGIILAVFSTALLGLAVNWMAAGLLGLAIIFYAGFYTLYLKPRTDQNIVIGGAAGAFPPLIGWVAVTGNIALSPIILFMIIFLWTPPHFWALALLSADDYAAAGIPMLPNTKGADHTKKQILGYTITLIPFALAPYFMGMAGIGYLIGSTLLSAGFVIGAIRLFGNDWQRRAKQLFGYSILYLFMIFTLLVIA